MDDAAALFKSQLVKVLQSMASLYNTPTLDPSATLSVPLMPGASTVFSPCALTGMVSTVYFNIKVAKDEVSEIIGSLRTFYCFSRS